MADKNGYDKNRPESRNSDTIKTQVDCDQFRLLAEATINYAIYLLDPEGRILSWNAGAERINGYRAEEILGEHFSVLFTRDDVRAGLPQRELERARTQGKVQVEGWRVRKDRSRFWASISTIPLYASDGALTGYGKIVRDSTEQRSSEESLLKSRRMYERLFENAPDGVVLVDSRGTIRKVNQQVEVFFGYQREQLIGHRVELLIPERYHQVHRQHRKNYFIDPRTRKMGVGLELFGRTSDGREVPVDIMLSPIVTDDGTWAFAVIRDVTERKQNEQAINDLNDLLKRQVAQLAATNRELEAFSYSVSHDLRAPLRALDGISLALLEDYRDKVDPTGQDFLKRIRTAAQTMGDLIDHLLTLSRLTRTEMHPVAVNLGELADQVVEELREQDPDRDVQVIIHRNMIDTGDANLLRIAITNLLGNAWKFTSRRPSGRIEFGLQENQAGERTYFIRDNGAGFNQAYAENLFKPFQRLHGTGEFPGTGIGLATVHRVISRHGGRIWAEGSGAGATFYFTLA